MSRCFFFFFSDEAAVIAAEGWLSFIAEKMILFGEMISSADGKREGGASWSGKPEAKTRTRFAVSWGSPSFQEDFKRTRMGLCGSLGDLRFGNQSYSRRNHGWQVSAAAGVGAHGTGRIWTSKNNFIPFQMLEKSWVVVSLKEYETKKKNGIISYLNSSSLKGMLYLKSLKMVFGFWPARAVFYRSF